MLRMRVSSMMSIIILLSLSRASSRALDAPLIFPLNDTMPEGFRVYHKNSTTNDTANEGDFMNVVKATNLSSAFIKNGLNPAREMRSNQLRVTGGTFTSRIPWAQSEATDYKESTVPNQTASPVVTSTSFNKRSGTRHKHPNHSYNYRTDSNNNKKIEYYTVDEENESNEEYFSNENYNTITEDQGYSDFENYDKNTWQHSYNLPSTGYSLPSISTNSMNEDYPVRHRGCDCPQKQTRSAECVSPSSTLVNILFDLGSNVWSLVRLGLIGGFQLIVPLFLLKLIIIPLKILKLFKLFFNFFILLPFLVRLIFPVLSNTLSLPTALLQNVLGTPLSYADPRQSAAQGNNPDNINDWGNASATLKKDSYWMNPETWDFSGCPSRMTCELGALVTMPADAYSLQRIANYLLKIADWARAKRPNGGSDGAGQFRNPTPTNEPFDAFLTAFGERWTRDRCEIYNCSILFG